MWTKTSCAKLCASSFQLHTNFQHHISAILLSQGCMPERIPTKTPEVDPATAKKRRTWHPQQETAIGNVKEQSSNCRVYPCGFEDYLALSSQLLSLAIQGEDRKKQQQLLPWDSSNGAGLGLRARGAWCSRVAVRKPTSSRHPTSLREPIQIVLTKTMDWTLNMIRGDLLGTDILVEIVDHK